MTLFVTARKRTLGQGNIFRSVCQEFCPQWGEVCLSACWDTTPGTWQAPPQSRACWEIRSTSGRYASYWNAFLYQEYFCFVLLWVKQLNFLVSFTHGVTLLLARTRTKWKCMVPLENKFVYNSLFTCKIKFFFKAEKKILLISILA